MRRPFEERRQIGGEAFDLCCVEAVCSGKFVDRHRRHEQRDPGKEEVDIGIGRAARPSLGARILEALAQQRIEQRCRFTGRVGEMERIEWAPGGDKIVEAPRIAAGTPD